MISVVEASYAECRRIVRRSGSNFPLAFRLLPADQRLGMEALYAWLRVVDDVADKPGHVADKRGVLTAWREALSQPFRTVAGEQSFILPALNDTITRFNVPVRRLTDVLDGVESDLNPRTFETFDDLLPYCHQVASAVGLACLAIWGVRDPAATEPARAAGVAFQLTNILRDLGEDRRNGRVYLPVDELLRFQCQPDSWGCDAAAFQSMMRFQIDRAKEYYLQSDSLPPLLPRPARRMFLAIRGIYGELLWLIERRPLAVLTSRVRVRRWRKLAHVLRSAVK